MIGAKRQRAGFTLIELLIVAAIFSIAALMATTVFSNIQNSQRQIQSQQRVTSDGRYLMEAIARSVRTGSINYGIYTNGVWPNVITAFQGTPNIISLIDQQNVITCYRLNGNQIEVLTPATTTCDAQSSSAWTAVNPSDLRTDALQFILSPKTDAYRPVPRASTDCRADVVDNTVTPAQRLAGYDAATGTCFCRVAQATDCWADQACSTTDSGGHICTNPNIQPQVTIYMKTSSTNTGPGTSAAVELQTTVVSRVYQR